VATTTNSSDDPLVNFARHHHNPYYRGDEQNVLSRYYECAKQNNLDLIVRVTSDCPLIDGNLIRHSVTEYLAAKDQQLYLSNCLERTFPRGFDFEIFSFQMLEEAYLNATLPGDLEHVTPYINQNRSGKIHFRHITQTPDKSAYRLTLDTQEDFTLLEILIRDYQAHLLSAAEICSLLDKHPELAQINAGVEQKKV
jgi:spore coat polysaccharide biosynthesis protein SpsF